VVPVEGRHRPTCKALADGRPDRAAIEAVMPAVREQVDILDRAVAKSGYLVDGQFTFADINLLPILYRLRQAPEGAEALASATHLAAYYERHATRRSFKATELAGPPSKASST
jgi:glutathione S-transferase